MRESAELPLGKLTQHTRSVERASSSGNGTGALRDFFGDADRVPITNRPAGDAPAALPSERLIELQNSGSAAATAYAARLAEIESGEADSCPLCLHTSPDVMLDCCGQPACRSCAERAQSLFHKCAFCSANGGNFRFVTQPAPADHGPRIEALVDTIQGPHDCGERTIVLLPKRVLVKPVAAALASRGLAAIYASARPPAGRVGLQMATLSARMAGTNGGILVVRVGDPFPPRGINNVVAPMVTEDATEYVSEASRCIGLGKNVNLHMFSTPPAVGTASAGVICR